MDFFRYPRKSTLGSHRSGYTTANDSSVKKFEVLPKSLQIAETLRRQRNASNNENACANNIKNLSSRQPRKSMLGTRKAGRNSIIPPPCDVIQPPSPPPQNRDFATELSDSSADDTLKINELSVTLIDDRVNLTASLENERSRRDSVLLEPPSDILRTHSKPEISPIKTKKMPSPLLHRNVPIREMLPRAFDSKENSLIENETTLASEESILATTMTDSSIASETSCFGTTLKDITNTFADRTADEVTLRSNSVSERDESQEESDCLFKMLDLINTWMRRSHESIELYEKEIAGLQEKRAQASEEIERMKKLKSTLMKQLPSQKSENEYELESDRKPMATIPEDKVFSSPVGSPTKNYFQEMRSTIKFMKTPLASRAPVSRQSVMLTPHSMSFCLKSQYEQLFG